MPAERIDSNLRDGGIRLVSPPGHGHNHHSEGQFTIERFTYNEQQDVFICPSGKILVKEGRYSGQKSLEVSCFDRRLSCLFNEGRLYWVAATA